MGAFLLTQKPGFPQFRANRAPASSASPAVAALRRCYNPLRASHHI